MEKTRAAILVMMLAVAAVVVGAPPARAADSWLEGWEFEAGLYTWVPEITSIARVGDRRSTVEVSIGDVLDLVGDHLSAVAAGGSFEARRDRYILFVDSFGAYVDTDKSGSAGTPLGTADVDAKIRLGQVFLEYGVGYRLGRFWMAGRERPVTVDVLAGGRWYYYDIDLRLSASLAGVGARGARGGEDFDWTDPFIGGRWAVPLLDDLTLEFRGDIGGFGAGSELAWNVVTGLRYFLPWRPCATRPWVSALYKALDFEYEGSGSNKVDMNMRGPMLGFGVTF